MPGIGEVGNDDDGLESIRTEGEREELADENVASQGCNVQSEEASFRANEDDEDLQFRSQNLVKNIGKGHIAVVVVI